MGLTLRAFCRRHGLDPGNISRLERGIVPPSDSPAVLDTYAKALKLTPNSDEWHTLFEFAALASGTIPTPVAADPAARESLPSVFRALRKTARLGARRVSVKEIENWADSIDARSQLPWLIRRLIHATSTSVERIEFAAGEGFERRGWDGIVQASAATAYIPSGLSVWELSVGRDPARKVEADFRSRTKNSLGVHPAEATYIAVTARRWEGKSTWETTKQRLGAWKEVRVYDAGTLEPWLELAPAVDVWFARLIGKRTEGMVDADEYWKNLAALREPRLKPSLFLTSRENEIESLKRWLSGPPSSLAMEARSPSEVIDFLAAYLARLDDDERDSLTSRVVIVETQQAWSILCDEAEGLALVASAGLALDVEMVAAAVRNGHRVLLCSDRFATGQSPKLTLSRPYVYDLENALKESGFPEDDAQRFARDCGGSLTVLKRRVSVHSTTTEPEWSHVQAAGDLAPFALIGSWEDACAADQSLIARVSGRSYADMAETIARWSTTPDPPLIRLSGKWNLTSREDSWILLARRIRADHLDRWEEAAIDVLCQDDQTLDCPPEKRFPRNLHDGESLYSETLRNGIAETLAILASNPVALGSQREHEAERADRIVRRVVGGKPGWKRWASVGRRLPLLAEAAPDTFLKAIEAELDTARPEIMRLFENEGGSFFSRSLHVGLLWALETVAWDSSTLSRASIVLARLAEPEPGGRWAKHPENSLRAIYLPWSPQTTAVVEVRIKVLRLITQKCPTAGWRTLLNLLPSVHGTSSFTHRPAWRHWAANWRRDVTSSDYWKQVESTAQRILEMAEDNVDHWMDVIEHISDFPSNSRRDAITRLTAIDLTAIGREQRQRFADALRKQVRLHRSHDGADWVIADEEVSALEHALKHVEPDDPVARNSWLFSPYPELPGSRADKWSLEKIEEEVGTRRRRAVAEVFNTGGMDQILRLVDLVESPESVGLELAKNALVRDEAEVLPELLAGKSPAAVQFARGFARACFERERRKWVWAGQFCFDHWSAEQVASLALALPAERATWEIVEAHSLKAFESYWNDVHYAHLYNSIRNADHEDMEHAVAMLLRQSRPFTATCLLSLLLGGTNVDPTLLLETLDASLEADETPANNVGYSIQNLFQYLQAAGAAVDEARLARLEWAYLHVLDGRPASPITLCRSLASHPALFAEIMRLLYHSADKPESERQERTDQEKRRAVKGFSLLHSWATVPGFDEATKTIDDVELHGWVVKARELCRASGHIEVCDIQIGELLAHAPPESDGSWPCVSVRDLIEEIASEDLIDGFVIGTLNKRDVYWKSQTEGGDQERALANEYAAYARLCDAEWPATAAALRNVARDYENQAGREDADATARRLGR